MVGVGVSAVAFVAIGVVLGTVLPSARAAQAIGLLLFFLVPARCRRTPAGVMADALREISDRLPLSLANQAIREPWLGIGDATGALVAVTVIAALAMGLAARRTAL